MYSKKVCEKILETIKEEIKYVMWKDENWVEQQGTILEKQIEIKEQSKLGILRIFLRLEAEGSKWVNKIFFKNENLEILFWAVTSFSFENEYFLTFEVLLGYDDWTEETTGGSGGGTIA
ncbi:MAG: hypothetical protein QXE05_04595 [Nitrososphaeria archaeon]